MFTLCVVSVCVLLSDVKYVEVAFQVCCCLRCVFFCLAVFVSWLFLLLFLLLFAVCVLRCCVQLSCGQELILEKPWGLLGPVSLRSCLILFGLGARG